MSTPAKVLLIVLATALLPFAAPVCAAPPGAGTGMRPPHGRPAFLRELFPPELIMQYQSEIGLSTEQRTAITAAIKAAQADMLDLQWRLEDDQQKLSQLLQASHIDESAALAQAEQVMSTEQQIKKAHLTLLIRIKNLLSEKQQQQLRAHRRSEGAPRQSPD